MFHYDLIPDSTKFNGVTDVDFDSFSCFKFVLFVILHVFYYQPKFLGWVLFFLIVGLDRVLVVEPIIVLFLENCCYHLAILLVDQFCQKLTG
jgi:hypothetical protein